ncbi:MAG TPA: hypothetical protein PKD90_01175, partial [Phnomibacter sp.]|nr:hypothetical protein [Phnomibacter sp.]
TFKVLAQDEDTLVAHSNPFSLLVLTVLRAIKNKKASDALMHTLKVDFFRLLPSRPLKRETKRAIVNFLKMYVSFSKPEFNPFFE